MEMYKAFDLHSMKFHDHVFLHLSMRAYSSLVLKIINQKIYLCPQGVPTLKMGCWDRIVDVITFTKDETSCNQLIPGFYFFLERD
jgi:hypothetical protein